MKPRIFIGSSKEGLPLAEKVKDFFKTDFDCYLWTDDIFKFNDNFLETLMKEASLFDFGFMVFTKDDHTISREKEFDAPRDNVLFEYGLFLGRIGRDKAYIIIEEGIKIPSDMLGITLATINCNRDSENKIEIDNNSLSNTLERLKRQIDEKVELGYLGMLPSTVLAIGYFENFIKMIGEQIFESGITIEDKTYKNVKLKIIIPKDLDSDLKKKATVYYRKNNYEQTAIKTVHRSYPIYINVKDGEENLEISDMPTTLNGIDKAIDMYFKVGHIGKSNEQRLMEERELSNFVTVLKLLIKNDAFCSCCVDIDYED